MLWHEGSSLSSHLNVAFLLLQVAHTTIALIYGNPLDVHELAYFNIIIELIKENNWGNSSNTEYGK